jgi:hypothetical protein
MALFSFVIRGQSALRNHTVNMGMRQQVRAPSVQGAENTYLGAEPLGIGRKLNGGLRTFRKQKAVKQSMTIDYLHAVGTHQRKRVLRQRR